MSFIDRVHRAAHVLRGRDVSVPAREPVRLMTPAAPVHDTKASSASLLPKGAYGSAYTFFSPDGGRTMFDLAESHTVLAFTAYWYVATRWRAQKIAEAPLMVVEENQETGAEEWLSQHDLADMLDAPSPDYDMGELLDTTSHYLDNSGAALWVIDTDNAGRPARVTPFARNEFDIQPDATRMYARFIVQTAAGRREYDAEQVCYFRDAPHSGRSWYQQRSRLSAALSWLQLGQRAVQTVHDLFTNSVWPSSVFTPDKEWNPDPETFDAFKQDLQRYASPGMRGKVFVALGGGTFTPLTTAVKDLVPSDVLGRVESVVAAISGVPAIVLQFQIGLENSPWSQMEQARRMAYDDTIDPSWKRIEKVLTRQLLRVHDDDRTHFVRFDRSNVAALAVDRQAAATTASLIGQIASVNERRVMVQLEPVDDERADEIPALITPDFTSLLAGLGSTGDSANTNDDPPPSADPNAPPTDDVQATALNGAQVQSLVQVVTLVGAGQIPLESARGIIAAAFPVLTPEQVDSILADVTEGSNTPNTTPADSAEAAVTKALRTRARTVSSTRHLTRIARKLAAPRLQATLREEAIPVLQSLVGGLLARDAEEIAQLAEALLTNPNEKRFVKARGSERFFTAVSGYLRNDSRQRWAKATTPLLVRAAERSVAVIAADLSVNYNLLHPSLLKFAGERVGQLITRVTNTTKELVNTIVEGGLEEGANINTIARTIREATGFSSVRAKLVARTETTTAFNGAPTESLAQLGRDTGRRFTKTWSGALDDRERDEHLAMEGETVPIDQPFSNGLQFPSEPNCRCTALYNEEI